MADSTIITAADYADALTVARRAKNWLFLLLLLMLLAQIAINGTLDPPKNNADYSRVALIVSMCSVFASLYLDAAFSRFDEMKDSVMAGQYGKKNP